jgi:hypothetical protein
MGTRPMQFLACCDYFRTSLLFGVPDIYRFVGATKEFSMMMLFESLQIHAKF